MFSYFTDELSYIGCLRNDVRISSLLEKHGNTAEKVFVKLIYL